MICYHVGWQLVLGFLMNNKNAKKRRVNKWWHDVINCVIAGPFCWSSWLAVARYVLIYIVYIMGADLYEISYLWQDVCLMCTLGYGGVLSQDVHCTLLAWHTSTCIGLNNISLIRRGQFNQKVVFGTDCQRGGSWIAPQSQISPVVSQS